MSVSDSVLMKALELVGNEAAPLTAREEHPNEKSWQRHRIVHTLIRLGRLVLLDANPQTLANDVELVRKRVAELCGGELPSADFDHEPPPLAEMPCLNCSEKASETRDEGIPMCAACGVAWDQGEWGAELR